MVLANKQEPFFCSLANESLFLANKEYFKRKICLLRISFVLFNNRLRIKLCLSN